MDLSTDRRVIGAGTFNGYPLGVGAALATLTYLEQDDGVFYRNLASVQARLVAGLREIAERYGRAMLIQDCPGVLMFYPVELDRAWTMADWYGIADHALGERIRQVLFENGVVTLFRGRWFIKRHDACGRRPDPRDPGSLPRDPLARHSRVTQPGRPGHSGPRPFRA